MTEDELTTFRALSSSLGINSPGFTHPTRQEVRDLIQAAGWNHIDLRRLLGVSYSAEKRFSPTVSSWTQVDKLKPSKIQYDTWRFMLIMSGVISLDEHLDSN